MRVYFEKPRTTVGWKGLINDPDLDETYRIDEGLRIGASSCSRSTALACRPAASFSTPSRGIPRRPDRLGAFGARTTESRSIANWPPVCVPIGFKNGTDDNVRIAIDAIQAAAWPDHFLSVTSTARSPLFRRAATSIAT